MIFVEPAEIAVTRPGVVPQEIGVTGETPATAVQIEAIVEVLDFHTTWLVTSYCRPVLPSVASAINWFFWADDVAAIPVGMMVRAVYFSKLPPSTEKEVMASTKDLSGFIEMEVMAAVPWLTEVTVPIGVARLRVAQDEPAAEVPTGQVVQVAPLDPGGQAEIVQDSAARPVGQAVVTVATPVLLELQLVVMAGLARPAVTSCVIGGAEKVPMASSWLVWFGTDSEGLGG